MTILPQWGISKKKFLDQFHHHHFRSKIVFLNTDSILRVKNDVWMSQVGCVKNWPRFDILVVVNDIVDHSMSKNFEFFCCSHVERTKYLDKEAAKTGFATGQSGPVEISRRSNKWNRVTKVVVDHGSEFSG